MNVHEVDLDEVVLGQLLGLSRDWEAENSCQGYLANGRSDIEVNRIFVAEGDEGIIGYLFGHEEVSERATSIMAEQTKYFEVEELYVRPEFRSKGIGKELFSFAEEAVKSEVEFMMLSTATKNWKSIFHFYLEELGMEFWSARLYKKV